MEFSHPYFQRNNVNLLSKIHRKPPTYNFAANFLNNNLPFNTPVNINSLCDQITANGSNRIILGTEFNRLSEAVRQMRSRQESTTQQMHILRAENQFMYRQISQLRSQLEQQGQLIQTLFNFLSAIASDRRSSGIRIGSGKRKLALTGAPTANRVPACVEYNLDPTTLPEKARLVASNSQIKRVLFSQPQATMTSTSGPSDVMPRCDSSTVEVLTSPSNTTVLSQSPPILAIQDVTPARKRSRSGSVIQRHLSEVNFTSNPPDVLSFTPDLLDAMASGESNNVTEEVITPKPFEEEIQGFDEGFVQSYHSSPETEDKTSSGDKSTFKHGRKSRSAVVSRSRPPVRRCTVQTPDKNSSILSTSPMLANVNREENIASPYIPGGEDLLSSNSPAQKGFKIAELTDVEGDFPWDSETNQPADGSLMNDIVSMGRQEEGGREDSIDGDRNMDDVVANFMIHLLLPWPPPTVISTILSQILNATFCLVNNCISRYPCLCPG
ncbi:Heat shock factor protein [Taenia crassiceps]|uniref:Heat shock factor protein n=1 Tax=Taenia crassiceps TaxID=6207 RepID=A0ABR4QEL8_9CEST